MIFFSNFGFKNLHKTNFGLTVKKAFEKQPENPNIFANPFPLGEDTFELTTKSIDCKDSDLYDLNPDKCIDSEPLKIELQIDKTEKKLGEVEKEQEILNVLDIIDVEKHLELEAKKQALEEQLGMQKDKYRDLGFVYLIADTCSDAYKKTQAQFKQAKVAFLGNPVFAKIKKLIPGWEKRDEISQTLHKFCCVQDSLLNKTSKSFNSFGTDEKKMQEFVTFMAKANKLDSMSTKLISSCKNKKSDFIQFLGGIQENMNTKALSLKEKAKDLLLNNPVTKLFKKD